MTTENSTKNKAQIKLLKSFYQKKIIEKTIQTYEDFMQAKIEETPTHYLLKFKQKTDDYPMQTLIDEFTNYLLAGEYESKKQQT